MTDLISIEQAAQRLEWRLLPGTPVETRVLCGLAFMRLLQSISAPGSAKAYLIQFLPRLTEAVRQANTNDFLPADMDGIEELVLWLSQHGIPPEHTEPFARLAVNVRSQLEAMPQPNEPDSDAASFDAIGLVVEYHLDPGLQPRGRILRIRADVSRLPDVITKDDIHIINRLIPDDRLLKQAIDAVAAARLVLDQNLGISAERRFRFDFHFDSAITHLAGNSIGLALGAAAICAVSRIEPVRTTWQSNQDVAYAATIDADGRVGPVDAAMLRHKIARAFYSPLSFLVVARSQLQEAWAVVNELETQKPGRRLEMVGVEQLPEIPSDQRLVHVRRAPLVMHVGRRLAAGKGRYPVLILPVLLLLTAAWWFLSGRYAVLSFAFLPDGVHAFDRLGFEAWHHDEPAGLDTVQYGRASNYQNWLSQDFDQDGNNDLALITNSPDRSHISRLVILSRHGKVLLDTVAFQETAVDSIPRAGRFLHYFLTGLIPGTEANPILVMCTRANSPAREYWVFMRPTGEVVGRYHSRGYGSRPNFFDIDDDGVPEMVVAVIHNGWERASVYAIKPVGATGFSPPGPLDSASNPVWLAQPAGNQLVYYILPHTDLCTTNGLRYPEPWQVTKNAEGICVETCEEHIAHEFPICIADLIWVFSPNLQSFDQLVISDNYWGARQKMATVNQLPLVDRDSLRKTLESGVMRWTGAAWVPAK